jgi:hypothetical protein
MTQRALSRICSQSNVPEKARFLMSFGRLLARVTAPAVLCVISGCAGTGTGGSGTGSGSLFAPSASVNSLKTSLSHLEYENRQLKNNIAKLDSENREIESELVQEKAANGDLSARLDDARNLLSQRGTEANNLDPPPSRTLPAGQSSKKRRKPPFAQIPGRIDPIPEDTMGDQSSNAAPAGDAVASSSPSGRAYPWFPVAEVSGDPAPPRR